MQFQLSGNHPVEDECDGVANADLFGWGPGFYPVDALPIGLHPLCQCGYSAVLMRPVDEWDTPRGPPPDMVMSLDDVDLATVINGAGEWSPVRIDRARATMQAAIFPAVGRSSRRAA